MTVAGLHLNIGCGLHPIEGYVNIDAVGGEGVDVIWDADHADTTPLPYPDDSVDSVFCSHMIEHVARPLPMMQELWRVARPGCEAVFLTPYGSSDDAWENPTHVRPMYVGSWAAYGASYWWREDYGYSADWQVTDVSLLLEDAAVHDDLMATYLGVTHDRNMVHEMRATLIANKPARARRRELQADCTVTLYRGEEVNAWERKWTVLGQLTMGLPK